MRTAKKSTLTFVLLLGMPVGLLLAQQATFTSASLTPDAALKAARAALETCRKNGHQAAVSVNDRAGNALVMLRDRFAGPHTVDTAINKAYTAVTFKLDTTSFTRSTQGGRFVFVVKSDGRRSSTGVGVV